MYDLAVQKQKMYCVIGPIEYVHISLKIPRYITIQQLS